nr:MAG TPA: hypothetical protein [Caudoviricetes sp.]DAY49041.1 MAG TPA: hypothetical protein [Caudoviricetes sp.]
MWGQTDLDRLRKEVESFLSRSRLAFIDEEDLAFSIHTGRYVDQLNPSKYYRYLIGSCK